MNSNELLAMAHQLESADWSKKMHGAVKKLKPTDFDTSTSQLCVVDSTRANKLHTAGIRTSKIFIPSYETGIIVIVPPKQRFALDTLALTLALLELLYDLRVYSAYFRLVSVNGNFGAKVHQVLHSGLANLPEHNEVSWKVLQRHFNHHEQSFEPVAQPHFQHEDVLVEAPLQTLSEVLPSGPFWNENSYIFMTDNDTPVSLHLLDVITNTSNHVPLESGVDMHMRRQLWEELGLRYLNHESMRNEAIRKYTEL